MKPGETFKAAAAAAAPGVARYLLTVEYIGTKFKGWQKQNQGQRTVQGVLDAALGKFMEKPVVTHGSSRTDTGVHALGNTCHVDLVRTTRRRPGEVLDPFPAATIKKAVNHFLLRAGGEVQLTRVERVPTGFHARYHATERVYNYRIVAGSQFSDVFERERAWNLAGELDVARMNAAARVFVGLHDFSTFRATGCQSNSPLKTLEELEVVEIPAFGWQGAGAGAAGSGLQHIIVKARAPSFLYHQVRLLVGALKEAGENSLSPDQARELLAKRDVTAAPAMAPAHGLYLAGVFYDDADLAMPPPPPESEDEEGGVQMDF